MIKEKQGKLSLLSWGNRNNAVVFTLLTDGIPLVHAQTPPETPDGILSE